jgi:hypothetical protein
MKTILFAAALACAMPAFADARDGMATAEQAGFDAYLASPAYAARLGDLVTMAKPVFFAGCETLAQEKPGTIVLKPVHMGSDGAPKDGMWKSSVPVNGCGKGRIVNAFFLVGGDNKVHFLLTHPGTTMADPTLQRDTVMYVQMAAVGKSRDCKTRNIVNTRFVPVAAPSEDSKTGAALLQVVPTGPQLNEVWTVDACGKFLEVPVHYLKSMTGTTITASDAEVVEITPEQAAKP